ncbi:MAG: hypothetical protein RL458_1332 [Pseudomonadota bacterium]|jgi:hypothetical protein
MTKLRPDYIFDRRPTQQDADNENEILELTDEEAGDWRYVIWDELLPDRAWRHTDWWRPQ